MKRKLKCQLVNKKFIFEDKIRIHAWPCNIFFVTYQITEVIKFNFDL